jgi:hypothetical protein
LMPQTPSGCSAVGLCRFRSAHFRYETSRIGDHAAVARRTRTRRTPDLNRVRLLSQIPGMLRKQRKGNVPDTGGDIHKAKRRAADIDDAALNLGNSLDASVSGWSTALGTGASLANAKCVREPS